MGVKMKECELPFGGDGNVLKLITAVVIELGERTKSH